MCIHAILQAVNFQPEKACFNFLTTPGLPSVEELVAQATGVLSSLTELPTHQIQALKHAVALCCICNGCFVLRRPLVEGVRRGFHWPCLPPKRAEQEQMWEVCYDPADDQEREKFKNSGPCIHDDLRRPNDVNRHHGHGVAVRQSGATGACSSEAAVPPSQLRMCE